MSKKINTFDIINGIFLIIAILSFVKVYANWNANLYSVNAFTRPDIEVVEARLSNEEKIITPDFDDIEKFDEDLYWLSRIVYAEARGEDDKGQQMVAEVIINRVNSPLFKENNIYDVIFAGNGKQFTPVANGKIHMEPDEKAIKNARIVLENGPTLTTEDILYFHGVKLGKNKIGTKWWGNVKTAFIHGGHVFASQKKK